MTQGIRVQVTPRYLPEYSKPEEGQFVFGYHVVITNTGKEWVKLISRRWIIINADGKKSEVRGSGVIGQQPELFPGESHEYVSFCPIDTDWGTMEGAYQMRNENGEMFDAVIGRFYLAVPKDEPVEPL